MPTRGLSGLPGSCAPSPHELQRGCLMFGGQGLLSAALSPQPWVLGAGQGLLAVSFLPFLGRKPGQCRAPGWSLSRGGGLSHHPVLQGDSALGPHPSLGSLGHGGRWINGVAAWAGQRAQATAAGRRSPATSVPPPMARSGTATPPAPAPGAPPQGPAQGLVQVRWGGGRVGSEDTSSQPVSLRLGRGDSGDTGGPRAQLQAGPGATMGAFLCSGW